MQSMKDFVMDEDGFTGAEKALFALLALGLILFVGNFIKDGSEAAAKKAKESLTKQKSGTVINLQ